MTCTNPASLCAQTDSIRLINQKYFQLINSDFWDQLLTLVIRDANHYAFGVIITLFRLQLRYYAIVQNHYDFQDISG